LNPLPPPHLPKPARLKVEISGSNRYAARKEVKLMKTAVGPAVQVAVVGTLVVALAVGPMAAGAAAVAADALAERHLVDWQRD
jgi:hypothetical protein